MFFKIDFLKTFINFIGKHLCWSLFLRKLQDVRTSACNFIKKRLQCKCFPVNIAKFLNTFFDRTPLVAAFDVSQWLSRTLQNSSNETYTTNSIIYISSWSPFSLLNRNKTGRQRRISWARIAFPRETSRFFVL